MRSKIRLIALFLILAAVAGCGGGDNEQPAEQSQAESSAETTAEATPAGPTKTEFIAQADEVCADYQEATKDIYNATMDSFEEFEAFAQVAVEETQHTLDEFRALPVPEADAKFVDQYLSLIGESVTLFKRMGEAAESENGSAIQTYYDDLTRLTQRQRGLAQGYGFKVCGAGE